MLGMWKESIKSNQAALSAAKGYVHALDFMVYAYLQLAQDIEAKRGVERSMELQKTQGALGTANPTGAVLVGKRRFQRFPRVM